MWPSWCLGIIPGQKRWNNRRSCWWLDCALVISVGEVGWRGRKLALCCQLTGTNRPVNITAICPAVLPPVSGTLPSTSLFNMKHPPTPTPPPQLGSPFTLFRGIGRMGPVTQLSKEGAIRNGRGSDSKVNPCLLSGAAWSTPLEVGKDKGKRHSLTRVFASRSCQGLDSCSF